MGFFGLRQGLEPLGDLVEALLPSRPGHPRIHVGVFVGFAGDRRLKIILGRADRLAGRRVADLLKIFEMAVSVTRLALGCRAEYRRHVVVTLDIRLLSKIEVAPVGLALAGKRSLEVFLSL